MSTTIKTIVFSEYGAPSVLHALHVDEPHAGPGMVRVRVKTAGVNPFDCKLRGGEFSDSIPATFPQTIGNEFSGIVDEIGEGVSGGEIGRQVLGFTSASAYAEVVVVPADQLTAKPSSMAWEVAGALSVAGQTAYHSLQDLNVTAGETLLIHGASGGVGTVAVQLARAAGATVIGTASPDNHDYLRSLGAIAIDYGEGLVARVQARAPERIDAVLDLAGGDSATAASLELVEDKMRIGTVADETAADRYGIRRLRPGRSARSLAALADLHTQGVLKIPISAVYLLVQASAAHRELETGHRPGKIVLTTS
ncbi:NADP-dependent oxidoreductase [Pseudonocardia sp. Cha107L01]|uniref:NADP-dependent oxidoreductase n=1 Tax=Pseudonocardia sp. Cha107L01 TaxID=3457576 RepID=UPI00403E9D6A